MMTAFWVLSYAALWILVLFLGFLLLGALRTLGLLSWRLEQLQATTPSRLGRGGLKPGKKAPDFTLPAAAGGEVSLHDFSGRKVLLVFVQGGCSPCHQVVPELNRLGRKGEAVVLAVFNGPAEAAGKWAGEVKAAFPVLAQQQFAVSKRYEVFATPFAFLIDEKGIVRSKGIVNNAQHVGYVLAGQGTDAEHEHHAAAENGQHRAAFEMAYASQALWDIGRPQAPFAAVADRVTGPVLDAGCGTGDTALFFTARGHRVTGIDFLEQPIRMARLKAAERGLSATFLVRDALTLGDWSERFASVIDSGLFHVFGDDDRRRYVRGLTQVVEPGGRLFLMCYSDAEAATDQFPRRVSRQELYDAFADGWEVESVQPVRVEVNPACPTAIRFSEGGPKGHFAVVRRQG